MDSSDNFHRKKVDLEGRSFALQVLRFDNGFFVSVAEGANRIGSVTASLATGPVPTSTVVIPSRSESLFLKLAAEQLSSRVRGIALVSSHVQREMAPETAKALMSEIVGMVSNE